MILSKEVNLLVTRKKDKQKYYVEMAFRKVTVEGEQVHFCLFPEVDGRTDFAITLHQLFNDFEVGEDVYQAIIFGLKERINDLASLFLKD